MISLEKRCMRMIQLKKVVYVKSVPQNVECILGADIGGTNSNFGFFLQAGKKAKLLFSIHAKSQEVSDFSLLVKMVLDEVKKDYGITVNRALFGAAGVVTPKQDYSKPTNASFSIDAHAIEKIAGISCVHIVNDFEVIGYGLDQLDPKSIVQVKKGKPRNHANKAIIGAGTGLGKCIMDWNKYAGRYIPVASEGGHADFPVQHEIELNLLHFIKKIEGQECNVSWEDVLSGYGIQRIYRFFHERAHNGGHTPDEKVPHPDEIFNSRNNDTHSKDTFELYTRFYARCAKDYALNALALGGVYIAGGIAAHNLPMFELPIFHKEFVNCGKQKELLEQVPVYVITDYNVSLYGAAAYLLLEDSCS